MKIFNKEQDKEKVYVQMNDIMELTQSNIPIPASIVDKVFGREMLIVNDDNRDDFIEFDNKKEVEFFKSLDWIVDYKKYRDLSKEELEIIMEETLNQSNEIANKYNNLSFDEKEKNIGLVNKFNFLNLKLQGLKQILFIKEGKYKPPFPLVPDSDGFSLGNDNPDSPYKIAISLDPNKYLLYRIDGVNLQKDENVPGNFIQTGLCIGLMNRKDIPTQGDCEVSYSFSSNNKYLVISTRKIKKKEEKISQKEEEKGFKKVLNKIFNRKKKS